MEEQTIKVTQVSVPYIVEVVYTDRQTLRKEYRSVILQHIPRVGELVGVPLSRYDYVNFEITAVHHRPIPDMNEYNPRESYVTLHIKQTGL